MEGLGEGYEAFVERLQSAANNAAKSSGNASGSNAAAHPPHPTQSQLHQSRYVGYPSTSHPFTVKRETSPALSESSMRSRESYSLEVSMQEAVTSPAPPSISGAGQPPRAPSPGHNYSTDVNQMPDSPPRRRGHRRAQSEIAFRLPDEASFEREMNVQGSEVPGGNYSSDAPRRPRHQHSSSMDGSTSFKHDMLVSDFEGSDGKKAMASAKLSEIALIDPKRAI